MPTCLAENQFYFSNRISYVYLAYIIHSTAYLSRHFIFHHMYGILARDDDIQWQSQLSDSLELIAYTRTPTPPLSDALNASNVNTYPRVTGFFFFLS